MSKEIATVADESNALMALIQRAATDTSFDVSKIDSLLAAKERWEKSESIKAFNAAFSDFKSEAVQIIKRTPVKDGPLKGKFHANLFDIVHAVTPNLSKHGLAISWKLTKDEPAWMEVSCVLRHAGGHSESVSMGSAPDSGPGRNAIQARGSAKTYLEKYTATAILGLAAQDADDDGLASGKPAVSAPIPGPTEAQVVDPISFQVLKVSKMKTNPVQFKIETPEGEVLFTLSESVALGAKTAHEHKATCRAMVTKKGNATWIDSLEVGKPAQDSEGF